MISYVLATCSLAFPPDNGRAPGNFEISTVNCDAIGLIDLMTLVYIKAVSADDERAILRRPDACSVLGTIVQELFSRLLRSYRGVRIRFDQAYVILYPDMSNGSP